MNSNKILSPKLDVVFQILFGEVGSENITKDFLNSMLDEKINEINLNENIVLRRENIEDKMGIVDVLAKINNNEYCNIEMQMTDKANLIERLLYYWSRQYAKSIKKGKKYEELKRTIAILITNFEVKGLETLSFHSKWKIIEDEERKIILTEHLEIHIIELPKIYKRANNEKDTKLIEWLSFLENPESEEVLYYMENNKNIKSAKERLTTLSDDERVRRLAELREKALMDEREARYTGYTVGHKQGFEYGKEKGIEEGIREGKKEGKEEGRKEGIREGKEEGKKEGKEEEKREIARKMKEEKFDLETILKLTGLTKEVIESL